MTGKSDLSAPDPPSFDGVIASLTSWLTCLRLVCQLHHDCFARRCWRLQYLEVGVLSPFLIDSELPTISR